MVQWLRIVKQQIILMENHTAFTVTDWAQLAALAERSPLRAVRLAQAAYRHTAAEPLDRARAAYTLGYAWLCHEHLDAARPLLADARAGFAAHGSALERARCRLAWLLLEFAQSLSAEIEIELLELAEQLDQLGASGEALRARIQVAQHRDILGQAAEAQALLDQLAPTIAGAPKLLQARWLFATGCAAITHSPPAAPNLLAQALRLFAALRAHVDYGKCLFQLAWSALSRERLDQAEYYYSQAERRFTRLDLPIRRALLDRGVGFLYTRQGYYDQALRRQLRALDAFTTLGRAADVGQCRTNLGNIYYYAGWWQIALAYYQRAEALYERSGAVDPRLNAQRNQAMAYSQLGQLDAAEALLREVHAAARAQGLPGIAAHTLGDMAELLAKRGAYDAALTQFAQARAAHLARDSELDAADCAMEQGRLMLDNGDVAGAAAQFAFAEPLVNQHPYNRWRTHYGLARCAELVGDPSTALAYYRRANTTVAALRARLALEAVSSTIFAQATRLHADSLRCAAAQGTPNDVLIFSDQQRALVLQRALATPQHLPAAPAYRTEIDTLQATIASLQADESAANAAALDQALARYGELLLRARHHHRPAGADSLAAQMLDIDVLRTQLNHAYQRDWTALIYALAGDTLLITALTPSDLTVTSIAYDTDLQQLIEQATQQKHWLLTYGAGMVRRRPSQRPWGVLHDLTERIIPDAVRARLHPDHRLLVAPFEQLHSLPWASLRVGAGWLAEHAIVQVVPALTIWQTLATRPASGSRRALLIGVSAFGARAAQLDHVPAELATVARLWPGPCDTLADEQATCAALLERAAQGALADYRLLHIASHAQLLPARGMLAHIELWDGELGLAAIAGLQLGGAQVVLSACDGASAEALEGNEVLSLSWALLAAGAGAVVANVWPVGDHAAPEFMRHFYTALAAHGDAGRALAEAQRALIAASASQPGAIWNWGGYLLTGA